MTIVVIKGKKKNICMRCGNLITNRYRNAKYCKRCSEELRKERCKAAMKKYNKKNGIKKGKKKK